MKYKGAKKHQSKEVMAPKANAPIGEGEWKVLLSSLPEAMKMSFVWTKKVFYITGHLNHIIDSVSKLWLSADVNFGVLSKAVQHLFLPAFSPL